MYTKVEKGKEREREKGWRQVVRGKQRVCQGKEREGEVKKKDWGEAEDSADEGSERRKWIRGSD